MRYLLTILFVLTGYMSLKAELTKSGADTLISFKPGSGQSFGQEAEYFPQNVFGLPDTNGSQNVPSSDPGQVCSIGIGGEIILGFRNQVIIDGDGSDFTIFENAFLNPVTSKVFAEPAIVAVSSNGIDFVEFPFDSLTLEGCAGISPTNGKSDPFDPGVSGGNSFDLNDVGIDSIRYIKITDICQMVLDNPGHPYFDPIISGFDLDAVVSWYLVDDVHTDIADNQNTLMYNIELKDGILFIYPSSPHTSDLRVYDMNGILVHQSGFTGCYRADIGLPNGVYIITINSYESMTPFYSKVILNN